jgi:photosystem II stability/assembly factor-like uncharacterized protein
MSKPMSITKIIFSLSLLFSINAMSQYSINTVTEKKGVSLRAMSIPNKTTIWASGSNGSVAKSVDGGLHFEWINIEGYTNRDFRAIHAWNELEAIIVAIASPGIILKTKDGGKTWNKVFENRDSAIFLDAIHFKNDTNGFVIGDPIANVPYLLTTIDKGENWTEVETDYFKDTISNGESFFAASNSNLTSINNGIYFVTGGLNSRLWLNGVAKDIPIAQGSKSTGANSIAISPNKKNMIIVGGDFQKDTIKKNNIVVYQINSQTKTSGNNYKMIPILNNINVDSNPNGYKSIVIFVNDDIAVSCGSSGVDLSKNKGKSWQVISKESFHVVQKQPDTNKVFLAGKDGRIASFTVL